MRLWLSSGILSGAILLISAGGALAQNQLITGVRTWKFTDGSELRAGLYSAKDGQAVLRPNHQKQPIPFDKFIPDHQKILNAVASSEIELLKDPRSGISDLISVRTTDPDWALRTLAIGRERTWTRTDGKKAKGSLVNIADDEIYLLIGDAIWKMMVSDLGGADLAYLEGIKNGTEPAIPARVEADFYMPVPDGKPGHVNLWIDGPRFMDSKPILNFESALAKAKAEITAKLGERYWSLREVKERRLSMIEFLSKRLPNMPPDYWRTCYQITFEIEERKREDATRAFPGMVDDGGRCYFVFFDDGLPPQKKIIPADPK